MRSYGPAPRTQQSRLNDALMFIVGCTDKAFEPQTTERVAQFYGVTRAADVAKIESAVARRRGLS